MPAHSRLKIGVAALAGAAALAAPALAAESDEVEGRFGIGRISKWADRLELPKPDPGPVVPIVGEPDLGTAENAFGAARSGHVHAGQDIFAPSGTPLLAVDDAVVAKSGSDGSQGNYVYLYDERRKRTYVYMHMVSPAEVEQGERVQAGERLGGVGCTGSCWGEHLHFEIRAGRGIAGEALDPLPELERWSRLERPR